MINPPLVRRVLSAFNSLLQWWRTLFTPPIFTPTVIDNSPKNILIYSGPGTGKLSLKNMVSMIRGLVSPKYTIKEVDQYTIINEAWMNDTALLVIPGGADLHYKKYLDGKGNENIRRYVHDGGNFLGVCAGAYYSADRIEFAMGSELQVAGDRELKFFPELVEGPTYAGFHYDPVLGIAGQRAATVYWQDGPPFAPDRALVLYYNGGGHFVNAYQQRDVTILARYACETSFIGPEPAAMVECKFGKGTAILSGLHFEWDPHSLDSIPELAAIKEKLVTRNPERLELAENLLHRLGIATQLKPSYL